MDTVRVPLSVVPYEDPLVKYKRRLESVERDDQGISDSAESVETVPEDSVNPVNETSVTEGAQRSDNASASSETPKQN